MKTYIIVVFIVAFYSYHNARSYLATNRQILSRDPALNFEQSFQAYRNLNPSFGYYLAHSEKKAFVEQILILAPGDASRKRLLTYSIHNANTQHLMVEIISAFSPAVAAQFYLELDSLWVQHALYRALSLITLELEYYLALERELRGTRLERDIEYLAFDHILKKSQIYWVYPYYLAQLSFIEPYNENKEVYIRDLVEKGFCSAEPGLQRAFYEAIIHPDKFDFVLLIAIKCESEQDVIWAAGHGGKLKVI